MVGTSVSTIVLPLVVYEATGSATQTGGLFAIRVIPYLLFGIVAGPIADRWNRRRLIIGGNIAEGLLVMTIPIAHELGVLSVAQVYVVGLLSATAFVFSDAAVFGAVPALVGTERLAAANGFLGSMASAAEILGPTIGGVLATTIGPTNAIWVDAVSFLGAAAVMSSIRSTFRTGEISAGGLDIRGQVRRAAAFVRGHRTVAVLLLSGFGNSFAFGTVLGLLVPYGVEQLGLASDDSRVGLLYSAGGVGALAAGLALSRVYAPRRVKWITPSTLAVSSVMIVALAASTGLVPSVMLLVLFSLSISTTISVGLTYRQMAAPDELRSSVNVFGRMISWGGQPFGAATGAVLAGAFTVRTAYLVAAAAMATSALAAWRFLPASTALSTAVVVGDDVGSEGVQ